MDDIGFFVACLYIGLVWLVGQATVNCFFKEKLNGKEYLLAFAIGFAGLTLLSTFLYFTCRASVWTIRGIWFALGIVSLIGMVRRRAIGKKEFAALGGVFALWLFLLIPGVLGKDQYYVYRGNCTDQQTYTEETVALSMHSLGWYEGRDKEEIERISDVLWRGYRWSVGDRPSAGLMIAVMRANPAGEVFWVIYLYCMFMQTMIVLPLLYLFSIVISNRGGHTTYRSMVWVLAAALYCVGFWGQIQYDINAVSQLSSIAVLSALTALFFQYARDIVEKREWNKRLYALIVLLAAAGLVIYLESALVHGMLYLVTGVFLVLHANKTADDASRTSSFCFIEKKQIVLLAGIPVMALGAMILANYRIASFLKAQVGSSVSDKRQTWASYFNTWLLGKHGIDDGGITGPISRFVNGIVSGSGMYNITVNYDRYYGWTAILLTGIMLICALLLILCMVRPIFIKMELPVWCLWMMMFTGVLTIIGMYLCKKPWSAVKLLYYVSPYLYTFLCVPVLSYKKLPKYARKWKNIVERTAFFIALMMLLANGKMVLEKCNDIRVNTACLGYRRNYPSDMIPGLKMTTDFTFDTAVLEGVDVVLIKDLSMVSDNQFYLQYLKVKLTCAGIPWIAEHDVDYYGQPMDITKEEPPDGNIAVLEAVKNVDGRYEIRISH